MPGNLWGQALQLMSWGESHGPAIGGVLDGLPPNIAIDISKIQEELDQRRPGRTAHTSPRQEDDQLQVLSGVFEGKTLGTPLAFMILNKDQRPEDYNSLKNVYRPGHADYTYQQKYGIRDHRGGGRASARETAVRVVAGSIAAQVLTSTMSVPFRASAAVIKIGPHDAGPEWQEDSITQSPLFAANANIVAVWTEYLESLKSKGLSAGALIELRLSGVPAGLGEPVYDKLDADLAKAMMSINAVKAVEIGEGNKAAESTQSYDEMTQQDGKIGFSSNKAGGVLGGISTGQDIICRVSFKATSSTASPRQTVNHDGAQQTIDVPGRHDPCVGIRAVPIVKAMATFMVADHYLRWRGQCGEQLEQQQSQSAA